MIDFGAGEPDFATPDAIKTAGARSDRRQLHQIHAVVWHRRAEAGDLPTGIVLDYGVEYAESEVIVTAGGKQALFNAALALFGRGDEVITHAPYWPTLTEQVKLADATPVLVRTHADDGFAIRADAILDAVTAADARHHHQLAVQPDGRAHLRGRARRDRRDRRGARASGSSSTSATRQLIYDAVAAQPAGRTGPEVPRSDGALRIGVEGVRDDRLALRLDDRTGAAHRRLRRDSEPRHVERLIDHAESGAGRR